MPRHTQEKKQPISISLLSMKLTLPGCQSLKQKRSLLQPLLSRLHKEFNVSAAEIGFNDIWQSSLLGVVIISNDANHNARLLNKTVVLIETNFPEIQIEEFQISSE